MSPDATKDALAEFDAAKYVQSMSGPLPTDMRLALGQIESSTYLRNQLLRDSDWASMDHSVELRTPLVDAWLLEQMKSCLLSIGRFPNKGLLAGAPICALPEQVIRRRKTGFGIPVIQWRAARHAPSVGVGSREWAKMLVAEYEATLA